jgi:hypothetical protein
MRTLSCAIEQLERRDFTAHFGVIAERLQAFDSGKTFRACLVNAFGVYSNPTVSVFLQHVPIRRRESLEDNASRGYGRRAQRR